MPPSPPELFTFDELSAAPAGLRFPRAVAFQDVDAAGIVFFPRILEYMNDAFLGLVEASGASLAEALAGGLWAAPLRHAEGDFLKPMRFGDRIEVCVVRLRVTGSTVVLGYRVIRAGGDAKPLALGQTVHVIIEPTSFRRIDPPPWVGRALALIEPGAPTR